MGDGTKENPYTREDVLRLIKENGGTAEGLDLSEKIFKQGVDLSELELNGIILRGADLLPDFDGEKFIGANLNETDLWRANLEGANLYGANLRGTHLASAHFDEADLWSANLKGAFLRGVYFKGTDLWNVNLKGAYLVGVHLERADLGDTHLEGASLSGVEFPPDAKLEGADWGNYIIGEEVEGLFYPAADTYRHLKIWYAERGIYDVAGEFFYREMEAKRKAQSWKKLHLKIWGWVMRLLCGYGEKPSRVVISAAVVIFGLAAAYWLWGSFNPSSFWDTLYYSAASFTALGYGQWAPQPTGWAKGMGAAEAFMGVFMMALFLITFVRKMTR